jgi:hypothetical protein
MVLDELKRHPRIEQVGRDRMAKAVAGVSGRETRAAPISDEKVLDLTLQQWPRTTGKERPLRRTGIFPEEISKELEGR